MKTLDVSSYISFKLLRLLTPLTAKPSFVALALTVSLCTNTIALAAIPTVVRASNDYDAITSPKTLNKRVTTAQVVMADYALIAHDFPALQKTNHESQQEWTQRVDRWLIQETAFIHVNQLKPNSVNTSIMTSDETKEAIRPKGYNRAHVISVQGGLMDAKGTGTESPKQKHHSNGIATLGEMIREYIFEKLVAKIFEFEQSPITTVGSYAVVDFGFDVVHENGTQDRAGYILRQAHHRAPGPNSGFETEKSLPVEMVLRKYGLTVSGETYSQRSLAEFDYLAVQGTNTKTPEVIDFGAYLAVDKFEHPIYSTHFIPVVPTTSPSFIQPNPDLRVPLEQWGNSGNADPKADKPWVWSHELARAWAEGRADRSAFDQHYQNMLGPVIEKFKNASISCSRVLR